MSLTPKQINLLEQAENEQDPQKLFDLLQQVNDSFQKDADNAEEPYTAPAK